MQITYIGTAVALIATVALLVRNVVEHHRIMEAVK